MVSFALSPEEHRNKAEADNLMPGEEASALEPEI